MNNYRVTFIKMPDKDSDNREEVLGTLVLDDVGVTERLTLLAKAFRRCPDVCLNADRLLIERVSSS